MILVYILLIIFALYVCFIVIPAVLIFKFAFTRGKSAVPLSVRELKGTRYEPYVESLVPAERFLSELKYEKAVVTSREGLRLTGRYIDQKSEKTIIFVHGYRGGELSNCCAQARHYYEKGYNILLIVMRAHGESEGKMIGLGTLERHDLPVWVDYAAKKDGVNSIAIYGSSMGASSIGYASCDFNNPKLKALVLDCGYSSPRNQLEHDARIRHLPYFLLLPVMRLAGLISMHEDIYSKVGDSLKRNKIPAMFIHGTADQTVSYAQCIENYNACASEKELVSVEGADHIIAYVMGGDTVKSKLDAFLDKHLI